MEVGVRPRFVWFQSHALCTTHGTFPQRLEMKWRPFFCSSLCPGGHFPKCKLTVRLPPSTDFTCREGLSTKAFHCHHCWLLSWAYVQWKAVQSLKRELQENLLYLKARGIRFPVSCSICPHSKTAKGSARLPLHCSGARQFGMKPTLSQLNGVRERWYNSESKDLWTVFPLVVRFFCIVFECTDVKPQLVSSFLWGPFDSQSTEFSIVIFHRSNSCWQPLCVILFT